jgi:hypothetical protein
MLSVPHSQRSSAHHIIPEWSFLTAEPPRWGLGTFYDTCPAFTVSLERSTATVRASRKREWRGRRGDVPCTNVEEHHLGFHSFCLSLEEYRSVQSQYQSLYCTRTCKGRTHSSFPLRRARIDVEHISIRSPSRSYSRLVLTIWDTRYSISAVPNHHKLLSYDPAALEKEVRKLTRVGSVSRSCVTPAVSLPPS